MHMRSLHIFGAPWIKPLDGRKGELGDQVDHKARQVVGWEAVAQPHHHI